MHSSCVWGRKRKINCIPAGVSSALWACIMTYFFVIHLFFWVKAQSFSMSHLKSSRRQNDRTDADSILKWTNMVKVSLDESGWSRLGTEAQGSGVFNDLVFWYRQPLQIIRFTGTITQTAWISDSEAVAQVCLNHSPWGGGAFTPTGCFDLIGSGLPSAADPRQICCYSPEEASGRAACQREGREKSECRCRCFHCYAHFTCRHCVSCRIATPQQRQWGVQSSGEKQLLLILPSNVSDTSRVCAATSQRS